MVSETRYATSGEVSIAYRVAGEGPFDIVFVPGSGSHVELAWDLPVPLRAWYERFASFARVIHFDKRGTGMSDAVSPATILETRMDDVRAVMDAAGSERAAVIGLSEGANLATRPQRLEEAAREACPGGTEEEIKALATLFRNAMSPGAAADLARMNLAIDVRDVLPAIRIPTLVLHNTHDPWVEVGNGRYLGEHISGATYVELPEQGHITSAATAGPSLDAMEQFLRRAWGAGAWEESEPDRVLATVLFTDIVGSSEHATALGDREWRKTLEQHHELFRRQLARLRGREVDTAGDGFFASFDGPARAIRCACAISEAVGELGLDVRAGLHTGECEVVDGKVAGIAVHTGARVASQAQPGEVLVSSTVKDLVAGSEIQFADRGLAALKGIPGEWRLFAVER